jgi:hypothetical protein
MKKMFKLVIAVVLAIGVVFLFSGFASAGDAIATVDNVNAGASNTVVVDDHTVVSPQHVETLQMNLYPPNYGPMSYLQTRMVDVTEWMGSFPIDAYYPMMLQKNNIPAQNMYGVVKTISGNVFNKINLKELYPLVMKASYQAINDFGVGNTALRIFWIPKNWSTSASAAVGNANATNGNTASGAIGGGIGASGPADYFIVYIVLKTPPADIEDPVHQKNAYEVTARVGGPSAPTPEKAAPMAEKPKPKPAAAERDCSLYGKSQGLCD